MVVRVTAASLGLWLSGAAFATTYTYVGPTYTFAGSPYTTAMSVTGTFDTATPLPANMPETDIGPDGSGLVTAWSFSDGVNTLTPANSSIYPFSFFVATDALGNITSVSIELLSPQPPNTVGELINSIEIVSPVLLFGTVVFDAATCTSLFINVCNSWGSTTQTADSIGSGAFTPNFAAVAPTIAKSFGAPSVQSMGTTSLTFTLSNSDAATSLTGIAFTDNLPVGLVIATPNGLFNVCGGVATAVQGTSNVSLAGVTIAPSSSCTLTVNVTATAGFGSLTNTTSAVTTTTNTLPGNTASAILAVTPLPPAQIPALERWALWLLGVLMAMAGAAIIRTRWGRTAGRYD